MWGDGSSLGFLSLVGYLIFVCGAVLLWIHRNDVPTWLHDEFGALRRRLVAHTVPSKCPGLREESRFILLPTRFLRRLGRIPHRRINRAVILLCIGPLLLLLDFFI